MSHPTLGSFLHKLKSAIQDPLCRLCNRQRLSSGYFCNRCSQKLGVRPYQAIYKQGPFEIHAAGRFNPYLRSFLYGYKFSGKRHQALLSEMLCQYFIAEMSPGAILVTQIPSRKHQPNRVPPLAQRFAHELSLLYLPQLLHWQHDTLPQHTLHNKYERWQNLKNSFCLSHSSWETVQTGLAQAPRTLIIIDDLTTTGATLTTAYQALTPIHPSFEKIMGLAVCHVPLAYPSP